MTDVIYYVCIFAAIVVFVYSTCMLVRTRKKLRRIKKSSCSRDVCDPGVFEKAVEDWKKYIEEKRE